jgi:4-alpha-glucanotransferase
MIDAACETAVDGHWQKTPGDALLATLAGRFPDLPVVAEDLGVITEEVRELRRKYGLPGMSVLQFAFDHFDDNPHKPANITPDCVVYTGTHDNDTCAGWFSGLQQNEKDFVFQVLGVPPTEDIAALMIETAMQSRADLAVVPLQDFLGLGREARMNTPGVSKGNWRWQFGWDMLPTRLPDRIRSVIDASGRLHEH